MECRHCRNFMDVKDARVFYSIMHLVPTIICSACYNGRFSECFKCEEQIHNPIMYNYTGGKKVCRDCSIENNYIYCGYGKVYFSDEEAVYVDIIGQKISKEGIKGIKICKGCSRISRDNNFDKNGGACNRCYNKLVKNYTYKVEDKLNFLTLRKTSNNTNEERFYGVELEVQHNDDNEKEVGIYEAASEVSKSLKGFAILKNDVTVGSGFEIVTAPATYDVHLVKWRNFFKKFKEKDILSSFYCKEYYLPDGRGVTCGMHVHVNRSSLSRLQIGKILKFIYSKDNNEFISKIAERNSNVYNDFSKPKNIADSFGGDWVSIENRRTAVNIMSNKTIEFRLFKGTLDQSKFFKNLEFVKAIIVFANSVGIKDADNVNKFCRYVYDYSSEYPNLYDYLVSLGYCELKSDKKPKKIKKSKKNNKNYRAKYLLVKNIKKSKKPIISNYKVYYYNNNNDRKAALNREYQQIDSNIKKKLAKK